MKLFHYHHWTDRVEEMELLYSANGFRVAGRFGTEKTYHPPLTWEDFRNEHPHLRIVEVRRGKINVTFGQGNRTLFDHIGWLVNQAEHDEICERATSLGWKVNKRDRRTFIGTPFQLRIELQMREDVVDEGESEIHSMDITVKNLKDVKSLPLLFGRSIPELRFHQGSELSLREVELRDDTSRMVTDPAGVLLKFTTGL